MPDDQQLTPTHLELATPSQKPSYAIVTVSSLPQRSQLGAASPGMY